MAEQTPSRPSSKTVKAQAREARLKQALKANMARRKAQSRARTDQGDGAGDTTARTGAQDKDS
ncbi:hypothetical protein [Sulfitobacter sp. S190]|uniref:hypothetical protein n=1 Tax=Sulfitobacter sp. S190 TaxID=2867022 RepID=UPI0021A598BC|nr:hypothetical protein [Sulfitobacter sp. S190]UWR21978.1 hypothetical protein K3756_15020 [Sulfitobacter sp. S190]